MIKKILAAILPTICVYLLGSFIAASFDVISWGYGGRYVAALLVVCFTAISVGIANDAL